MLQQPLGLRLGVWCMCAVVFVCVLLVIEAGAGGAGMATAAGSRIQLTAMSTDACIACWWDTLLFMRSTKEKAK